MGKLADPTHVGAYDGIQTGSSMILKGDKLYYKSNKWNKYNDENAVGYLPPPNLNP